MLESKWKLPNTMRPMTGSTTQATPNDVNLPNFFGPTRLMVAATMRTPIVARQTSSGLSLSPKTYDE